MIVSPGSARVRSASLRDPIVAPNPISNYVRRGAPRRPLRPRYRRRRAYPTGRFANITEFTIEVSGNCRLEPLAVLMVNPCGDAGALSGGWTSVLPSAFSFPLLARLGLPETSRYPIVMGLG